VAVTDAEGRIRFANAAVAALLDERHDPAGLLGAPLVEHLSHDAADEARGELEQWLKGGDVQSTPLQVPCRSDRVYRVERAPLPTDEKGCVWTLRDVTQQRLAEQSRDQFIDTATHELRTPLSNIKAYAEMLATADEIDVEQQKEFCNIINAEVTRLARFVDDLLSISSMEVGTLTVDLHAVDLQRLLDEVAAKMRPLFEQKQLAFAVTLPPKLQEAKLDKDKIAAVLVNLLGNAAKYTPAGGRVAMRVAVEEQTLRIAIEDSGVGVEADELPRLFEKFFRSKDPRVQAETGTGLGLALAREVVRAHGGEIEAESVLNQGSTFTVSLPLT
jgi:two-component system phosphate regulon sensor histidine kinase PhoR